MLFSTALTALALIAGSYGQSVYLRSELSFGLDVKMSPDMHTIPNFTLMGDYPQIYSNKIILTAPSPGNRRAAIWSQSTLTAPKWDVSLQFRATGPERASGRLQLWFVKDGFHTIGTSSIYTAGKFEGLAIVVDQYGNQGGMIRAFLNDGSKNYGQHLSVDGLAFGHASYAYRNLGRPSKIRVLQDWRNFRVEVDDVLAFETSDVRIPPGYSIGVGAASADNPDSFELFSLSVATDNGEEGAAPNAGGGSSSQQDPASNQARSDQNQDEFQSQDNSNSNANAYANSGDKTPQWTAYLNPDRIPRDSDIKPVPASAVPSAEEFADLHYRLQALMTHVLIFQDDFQKYQVEATKRHASMIEQYVVNGCGNTAAPSDQLDAIDRRLKGMEQMLMETKRGVDGGSDRVERLRAQLLEGHGAILAGVHGGVGKLTGSLPRLGWVVLVVLGSQAGIVVAFAWYKRRKAVGMKKYL